MPHKQTRKQGIVASLEASSSALESLEPTINLATNPEPMAQTGEASSSSTKGKEHERKNWEDRLPKCYPQSQTLLNI